MNNTKFKKNRIPWNKGKKGYKCIYKKIEAKLDTILSLIDAGKSSTQISELVNINIKTLYNLLKNNNKTLKKAS